MWPPLVVGLVLLLGWECRAATNDAAAYPWLRPGAKMSDIPPPGMSSLTFVFDRTGSMNDDLVQVRHGAKGIFDTVMKQRKKLIYNYVLVLFHDPDVDPPFVTTDPDVFQNQLASVTVQGGGDCPEMALSGIIKALEVSLPGSYIYVFTDARAKDYHLEDRVLNLIQERQSSVVFVMTGDCGNRTAPGYRTFEKIAAASFGQVFHLEKSHVNTVLEYVRHAVEQRKVHMMYEVRDRGNAHISPVAVDALMSELTISLSGQRDDSEFLNITLIDPEGNTVDKSRYEHQAGTIDLRNVKLIRVTNPLPGTWQIRTTSKNQHTLRVFGHSPIDFKYGFGSRVVNTIEQAHPRPIANQMTYLLVNVTDLNPPGELMEIALLDYHGRTLYRNESRAHPQNRFLYYVGPFMPPKGFFFVRIQGEDENSYEFVRISSTAISTVDASGPRAYMADRTTATALQPVNLTCSVESSSPFTIYWKFGNTVIGGPLFYQHTDTSIWTIDSVTAANRGAYSCEVVSSGGNHTARTFLDSREPPPHIIAAHNESAVFQNGAYLHCRTQSIEQAQIVWERNGVVVGNSAKVYQYPNGTLRILDASRRDAGEYICRATTSGGTTEARIYLNVYDLPKVSLEPKELYVRRGGDFRLSCVVTGDPIPKTVWTHRGRTVEADERRFFNSPGSDFGRLSGFSGELVVRGATDSDMGLYECRGVNPAGAAADHANILFAIPPLVQITRSGALVGRGHQVVMDCRIVAGTPTPTLRWFKEGRELGSHRGQHVADGRLTILSAQDMDAGNYACTAENIAGQDTQIVSLGVGSPPSIVPSPERIHANIDGPATIPCRAVGNPRPTVRWTKDGKPLVNTEDNRFSHLQDDALLIGKLHVEDAGWYSCEAENEFGATARNTLLVVTGLVSPILAQMPSDAHLIEGKDLTLNCIVVLGTPPPIIKWLRNGVVVESSDEVTVYEDGRLVLKNGRAEQQGQYTCVASSAVGNATLNVNVLLIRKPRLRGDSTRRIVATPDEQLDLECPIDAGAFAKTLWTSDDRSFVANTAHHRILESNILRLTEVRRADAGRYTCTVSNRAGETRAHLEVVVRQPPVILDPDNRVLTLLGGDSATIGCDMETHDGDTPPRLEWLKDGQPLGSAAHVDSQTGALILDNADLNTAGVYKCVAENEWGKDERTATVNVLLAPVIDTQSLHRIQTVGENGSVVLECPARAHPPPQRSWLFEGEELFPNNEAGMLHHVYPNGSLFLQHLTTAHSGSYECRVSNLAGDDRIHYTLRIQTPPRLIDQLPETFVGATVGGSPVELKCRASGEPTPTIHWERDGVPLDERSFDSANMERRWRILADGTLAFRSPLPADSAVYKCVAKSVVGMDVAAVILKVDAPPTIRPNQKPKYQLISGQTASIPCFADGTPQPEIQWYAEGSRRLASARNDHDVYVGENGTLIFPNAVAAFSGIYTCAAVNPVGRADFPIQIGVLEPPDIRDAAQLDEQSVRIGQTVVLYCPVAARGDADSPLIHWLWNGRAVESGEFEVSKDGRRLTVPKAKVADAGKLTCVARNAAGESRKDFALEVNVPPHRDEHSPRRWTATAGSRVELSCPATGIPTPNVTWLQALNGDRNTIHLGVNGDTLVIEESRLSDAGTYVCVASNRGGSVDIEVGLEVLAPPKLVPPANIADTVSIGRPVTLACDVENDDPSTTVQWFFNGEAQLPPNVQLDAMGRRLIVVESTEQNTGIYSCTVRNQIGESGESFILDVIAPPRLIDPSITEELTLVEGETKTLRCDVGGGNPPPTVQWSLNGIPLNEAIGQTSLTVRADSDGDSAASATRRFSCAATNAAGAATRDFFVHAVYAPRLAPIEEPHRRAEVFAGNTATFECPVQNLRLEDLEIIWLQRGRPIVVDAASSRYTLSMDRTRLTILGVHHGDEGEVTCVARNVAGEAETHFELKVFVPPKIHGPAETHVELTEDHELNLECTFDGQPAPTIAWTLNGGPLPSTAKLLTDNRFLFVEKSTTAHSGAYLCRVENPAGVAEKKFTVRIVGKPKLVASATNRVGVGAEQSTTLSCDIESDADTETDHLWLKDGELVEATPNKYQILDGGKRLKLLGAAVTDSGAYSCIVKNRAGEAKQDFEVLVKTSPQITSATPHEFRAIENSSLVVGCEAHGVPKPQIQWLKDGRIVGAAPASASNAPIQSMADGQQLRFNSVQKADAGFYVCRATNEMGTVERAFAVNVVAKPVLMAEAAQPVDVIRGEGLNLNCPIKEQNFEGTIEWLYNSEPITVDNEKYTTLLLGRKLVVKDVNIEDRGTYSCLARNDAGESRADYAINVLVPPSISLLERDRRRTVVENGNLVLECPATGNPEPVIRWYKNGQKLNAENIGGIISGARFVGTALRIDQIRAESATGTFTCEAENEAGVATEDIAVEVMTFPVIDVAEPTLPIDGELGGRAEIHCPVRGNPPPTILWFRDGAPIADADTASSSYFSHHRQRLNFVSLKRADAGRYACEARNPAGEARRDFELRFLESPQIDAANVPREQQFIVNRTLTLSCPVTGQPTPTIVWLLNGEPLGIADALGEQSETERVALVAAGKQMKIERAAKSDEGRYSCIATNAAGFADLDIFVRIVDIPQIGGPANETISTLLGKPLVLNCAVAKEVEDYEIEWRKSGRIVGGSALSVDSTVDPYVQITDQGRRLHLLSTESSDAAHWSCIARNPAGSAQKSFDISIQMRPTLRDADSSPSLIRSVVGAEVRIHCAIDAIPPPQIEWQKEGVALRPGGDLALRDDNRTLLISAAKAGDSGRFVCAALNSVGFLEHSFLVELAGPPRFEASRQERRFARGDTGLLECRPDSGNPPTRVEWFRANRPLNGSSDETLMLEQIQLDAEGEYSCTVWNEAGSATKTFAVMVVEPPHFIGNETATVAPSLIVGRTLVLDCAASGNPKPAITWRKNNQLLQPSAHLDFLNTNQQLLIKEAAADDAGRYVCVAENSAGQVTKNLFVQMLEAPSMRRQHDVVEIRENETLTLECPIREAATSRLIWMHEDGPIARSPHIQVSDDSAKLHFIRIQSHQSGVYICLAENDAGDAEATFDVAVLVPPHIHTPAIAQRNILIRVDQPLTLRCAAGGFPLPEVKWLLDDVPFVQSDERTVISTELGAANLTIANATAAHEGRYTCEAANKAGHTDADIFLQVMEPPTIKTAAETVRVVRGKELTLRCEVLAGSRPIDALWLKGDNALASSVDDSKSQAVYSLRIPAATEADAGEYLCNATNSAGVATAKTNVEVLVPPKILDESSMVRAVVEGADLQLDCPATGTPLPQISWLFGGQKLQTGDESRLLLKNASAQQSGRYSCEAQNIVGVVSADFAVEVLVKPRVRPYEMTVRAVEFERARLECRFDGNPEPEIRWTRNGREITDSPSIILSPRGDTLLIPKVHRHDAGDYSCIVSNSVGQTEAPFVLLVQTGPHIDEPIDQNPQATEGGDIVLQCPVAGTPTPTVEWMRAGEMLRVNETEEFEIVGKDNLRIKVVTSEHAGRYTCRAENEISILDTDFELEVLAAPRSGPASKQLYEATEGDSIQIECPIAGNPPPTVQWFRGDDILTPTLNLQFSPTGERLKLSDVKLPDAGKYMCRATNVIGSTDLDIQLKVIVPPRIDESNVIRRPLAVLDRSIYLECPVFAVPPPDVFWLKDGRQIEGIGDEGRFSLQQNNQTFGIRRVEHGDRGIYTCVVENPGGMATQDFDMDVLVPPIMEQEDPEGVTVREEESVTLSCPVKANPTTTVNVSWTHDGRPLEPESQSISPDGRHLKLVNVHVAQTGQYKCIASNRAGQTHAKFDLQVLSTPKIEEEKMNVEPNVPVGRATTLWCPVNGNPPPKVTWFRGDGEAVREVPGKIRLLERGQGLEISEAGIEDIGTWTCRAENEAGITEKTVKLNVWVEPQVEVRTDDGVNIKSLGSAVTILCNATGNPKPALEWNFNGQIIIPSPESVQFSLSKSRLDILQLQKENAGEYTCIARNELGSAEDAVTVDILLPPEINRENVELNRRLPSGRSITLFCDANGKPTPKISWFANDTLITDDNPNVVIGTDNKFIQIINVTLEDRGVYKCAVENAAGVDELQYVITVDLIPSIANSGTQQVVEGEVAVLHCSAAGEPKPVITWQRNGIRVETGLRYVVENQTLKIIDTHSSDSGIYVCVAANEAGTDQQAFTLEVLVAPKLVDLSTNETIIAVGGEFSLSCGASGYPFPQVTWTFEDEPIEEALAGTNYSVAEDGTLTVVGIDRRGELPFRCVVQNEAGEDSASFVVKAISAPVRIDENELRFVNTTQGEPTILDCGIAIETADSEVSWTRDSQPVEESKASVANGRAQLQIDETTLLHEGIYECTVTNRAGNATEKTQLFVGVPPTIAESQRKIKVKRGEKAVIWCETIGIPTPTLQWHRDNVTVAEEHIQRDEEMRIAVVFENVQVEDEGVYSCVAENWAGVASKDFDLVVLTPPVIQPDRLDVNASLEDTIILSCNATGNPEPVVTWVKVPNVDLTGKNEKYMPLGTSLAVKNVSLDDDDFYHCIAKSEAGQAIGVRRITVNNFQLDGPPRVWVDCGSDERPLQGTYIPPRGDTPADYDPMKIEYLSWEDRHLYPDRRGPNIVYYKCFPTARDDRSGTTHSPAEVAPQFVQQPPRVLRLQPHQPLKIQCSAIGAPSPTVLWSKAGRVIHESSDGALELSADQGPFEGNYTCIVRNSAGEIRANSAPPPSAKPPSLVPATLVNCPNGTAEYWQIDGERIEYGDERMHVLANGSLVLNYFADDDELHQFECVIFGPDEKSRAIRATRGIQLEVEETPPRVRIPQRGIVRKPVGDMVTFHCLLQSGAPLTTRIRWTKDNVNLDLDGHRYIVWVSGDIQSRTFQPNNSLTVGELTDADRGSYKCRAFNRRGKSFDEVGLIVTDMTPTAALRVEFRLSGRLNGKRIPVTTVDAGVWAPALESNVLSVPLNKFPTPFVAASERLLTALFSTPHAQLAFDPTRNADADPPIGYPFTRTTNYRFGDGGRLTVKQSSEGAPKLEANGRFIVNVELDGNVPQTDLFVAPLESELTASDRRTATGHGNGALHFGPFGQIPFEFDDHFNFLTDGHRFVDAARSMLIRADAHLSGTLGNRSELTQRMTIDHSLLCPDGFLKIGEFCRDIDECTADRETCERGAECHNHAGSYECRRTDCPTGQTPNQRGKCTSADQCTLSLHHCPEGTECKTVESGVECLPQCPGVGARRDPHSGECVQVDECTRNPCPLSMECLSLPSGSFECVCANGEPPIDGECDESPHPSLQHITHSTQPDAVDCPDGSQWTGLACADIDECAFDAPCQYKCVDRPGSYQCVCPEGYVLDEYGQCFDIDECKDESICAKDELCFNHLGDYSCIRDACPSDYRLQVESSGSANCIPPPCHNCTKQMIHIYMLPLPLGLPDGTTIARLAAHDHQGRVLRNATFNDYGNSIADFRVDTREGRANVRLAHRMPGGAQRLLKLRTEAAAADGHRYSSSFHIYTAVSKYPF